MSRALSTKINLKCCTYAESEELLNALRKSKKRHITRYILTILSLLIIIIGLAGLIYDTPLWGAWFTIAAMIVFSIWIYTKTPKVDFERDEYFQGYYEKLNIFFKTLTKNRKVWEVKDYYKNNDSKYHAGAGLSVNRETVSLFKAKPPYMKSNLKYYALNTSKGELYFLPYCILINKTFKLYMLDINDITVRFGTTNFIENGFIPRDAEVIGYTWQFVNKTGSPNRRFSNNKQIPKCCYGEIDLQLQEHFKLVIMYSNVSLSDSLKTTFLDLIKYKTNRTSTFN